MKNSIVTLIALSISVFCFSEPNWYEGLVHREGYYFGLGEGASFEEAQQRALQQIASQILVKVDGELRREVIDRNGISDSLTISKFHVQIANSALGNVHIDRQAYAKGSYYIKLEAEKSSVARSLLNAYQSQFSKIEQEQLLVSGKSIFDVSTSIDDLENSIASILEYFLVAKTLNPTISIGQLDEVISGAQNLINKKSGLRRLYFSSPADLASLANSVSEQIQRFGWVIETGHQQRDALPKLELSGKFKNSLQSGYFMSALAVDLNIKDEFGNARLAKTFKVFGVAVSSYAAAQEIANKNFLAEFELYYELEELLDTNN